MPTEPEPAKPFLQRHPVWMGVAAGFLIVAVLGLGGVLWWSLQTLRDSGGAPGVLPNTNPPTVVRVQPRANPALLTLTFSEPLNAEIARDVRSYTVAGANPLLAKLDPAGTSVDLTLAEPLPFGSTNALMLTNLQDCAANVMPGTNLPLKTPVITPGFLRADYYTNITWQTVAHLTRHPKFPDHYDQTAYLTASATARDFGHNYGLRLWGFFLPPTNGNYTFYVRSDDESEVFLSTDSESANKRLVASQTGAGRPHDDTNGNPRFSTVTGLRAGQRYYFEALLKDGGGEDYLTVVYKAEGEPAPVHNTASVTPIPTSALACYADAQDVSLELTEQPASTNLAVGQRASFAVLPKVLPPELVPGLLYQWQRANGAGGYTNVPGATARRFTTPPLAREDTGMEYICLVRVPGATLISRGATVTISIGSPKTAAALPDGPPSPSTNAPPSCWPQFRGPNGQGVLESADPPIHFSNTSNVLWRTALPPGHSSPCLWGQRIFVTGLRGGQLETHAYDRRTGNLLWRQTAPAARLEKVHSFNSPASSTPAADAGRVFAYFGSAGVFCYSHEGKALWHKYLPTPKNQHGTASSPVLCGGPVVLLLDSDDLKSKLLALRVEDGEVDWQTERPRFAANWSTPTICEHDGQKDLLVLGSRRLTAYDADSGQERWWVEGFPPETIGLPVYGDGLFFVSAANRTGAHTDKYQGIRWEQLLELDRNGDKKIQRAEVPGDYRWILRPDVAEDNPGYADPNSTLMSRFNSIDTDHDGALTEKEWEAFAAQWGARFAPSLKAIRPGGKDDVSGSRVVWQLRRGIPEIPSPLFYRGRLYLVRDGGFVQGVRPADGEVIFEERVGVPGSYCASPVAANGRIYLSSHSGTVLVLDATADKLRVLAANRLGEKIWATPALLGNALYLRTEEHLCAFSAAP
jgi:outer membrane protein assembly factor BamB